jgi:hypothetical protein
MFLSIYGRPPKPDEIATVSNTLQNLKDAWTRKLQETKPQEPVAQKADWMAVATVCHTLFNSAEFIYID